MKRLRFVCVALVALTGSGCFSSKKPKPNKALATEVEEVFKQRWIAKRMADITAANPGIEARDARRQATEEFRVEYRHTTVAKKADPMGDGTLP